MTETRVDTPRIRGPWSREQAYSYLDTAVIPLRLAANTPSGFPVVLSLWFVRDGEQLLAAVHEDAKIARRLLTDPRVGYEVAPNESPYMGVRGRAIARLEREGAESTLRILLERYLGSTDSRLGRFLLGRAHEEWVVRLDLETLDSWDYRARMNQVND